MQGSKIILAFDALVKYLTKLVGQGKLKPFCIMVAGGERNTTNTAVEGLE